MKIFLNIIDIIAEILGRKNIAETLAAREMHVSVSAPR